MFRFERLDGPCGVPVFYQQLPEIIHSTGIALAVFTGAADDILVGEPGLHHWLEHVPFRGTRNFPGGTEAVKGPVIAVGGQVSAWTNNHCTNYWATLPTRHLSKGLDAVVDLVARPILAEESILAEREVIKQELRDCLSSLEGYLGYRVPKILWDDHPLADPVLGTEATLDSMTPELVRQAWYGGYDRSRMVFFVSTALSKNELLDLVSRPFEDLPIRGLEERRRGASHGPLPWKSALKTEVTTDFASAMVKILFPLPPPDTKLDLAKWGLLSSLFSYGGSGSPLYRAFRENSRLAYRASVDKYLTPDGGFWGFSVRVSPDKIDAVRVAFLEMLKDDRLRSEEWFETIKEAGRCAIEMEVINPHGYVDVAVHNTALMGEPVTREEVVEIVNSVPHQEVLEVLENVHFEASRVIVATK